MAPPTPTLRYNVDSEPVVARGLVYSESQLDETIKGPVKELLIDTSGTAALNNMLANLNISDFGEDIINEFIEVDLTSENWRVGEALAEFFVSVNDNCTFPWPTSRDLKSPDASPTGADLTGFQKTDDTANPFRFAFGEVKTSSDGNYPPNVMHGREGLKNQLEGLRDSIRIRKNLVKYLGHHAVNASWRDKFESAATRYFSSDRTDFSILGILVRDVPPNKSDLSNRATALAKNCPESTCIFLYALYLPKNAISSLVDRLQMETGGEEQ